MADEKISVAFLGAGGISEMHGRAIRACERADYVGVYDPDPQRAGAHAKRFGGKAYRSLEEVLKDENVHAVHVLSPHEHHIKQASACLEAGKHVIVEKPVAHTVAEIVELKKAAERSGKICIPGHNYAYVPALRRARSLIDSGRLGAIIGFWMFYNIFHSRELGRIYGGVTRAVCVHNAYSLLYLLGKPEGVAAAMGSVHFDGIDHEDTVSIMCRMPGGAIAHLWASFAGNDTSSRPWSVDYKVLGTKGAITHSWGDAVCEDSTAPSWDLVEYEESVTCEIDYFITRCILRGEPPLSSLDDAIDALRIVEAAERTAADGSGFVKVG